jgi:thiol:disulfide interchange protein DsbD
MTRLICAALFASALWAEPADPIAWRIQDPPAAPVRAGGRFSVKLVAEIQDGWHLYSMKPMEEGPIPTRIWMPEGQQFQLAGAIQATPPQTMQDTAFNLEVEFYEGQAVFTLPVRVAANAAPGAQKAVVSASYQTCDNKVCLPPKTVRVEVPVAISK